jgi:hypothetical protein
LSLAIFLRWIAYALLIGSIIPAGLSIPKFVKSRRAKYYGIRREALRQAMRWLLIMVVMQAAAIVLLVVCPLLQNGDAISTPGPTATPTRGSTATTLLPNDTATPRPTDVPTAAPTRRPTATPTPSPTSVPTAPPPDGPTPEGLTPTLSPVPAAPEASIKFTALAMEKDASGLPVNPGFEFPPGDHAMYVFFTYEGMQNGVERTFAWYKDDEPFERCSQTALWEWGDRGRTSYYCQPSTGWEPGNYAVHVFVEDELQFIAEFVIKE